MSLCATHVRFGGKADIVRHRVNQFGRMIQQMAAHERRREDSSAFESIMSKGDAMIKESGLAVGDLFTRRWLMAEAQLNPTLAQAFDQWTLSAEHARRIARHEKKAMERLLKAAKSMPDPDATANRMAVAAAVRGSAGKAEADQVRGA